MNAANVGVVPSRERDRAETYRTRHAPPGRRAVVAVFRYLPWPTAPSALDLGIVPGSVRAEMISATGDPTAYRVRGATIALRKQQAEWIYVEGVKERNA
jgi:hypothetical protein